MINNNNKISVPSFNPPPTAGLEECKVDRWTAVQEYRNRIKSAKRDLAQHVQIAFEVLDSLEEAEFLEIMTMSENGVTACDFLEKFRKWKGL